MNKWMIWMVPDPVWLCFYSHLKILKITRSGTKRGRGHLMNITMLSHFLSANVGHVKRRLISCQNSVMDIGSLRIMTKHQHRKKMIWFISKDSIHHTLNVIWYPTPDGETEHCAWGGTVQKGEAYVELEAMKMVMPLKVPLWKKNGWKRRNLESIADMLRIVMLKHTWMLL